MSQPDGEVPDGIYLVRVDQVRYRRERQKPFYSVRFAVIEPTALAGHALAGCLYCTTKTLWKFSWFLRDFGYDAELFGRDEIDDKALVGLSGVVKVTHGRQWPFPAEPGCVCSGRCMGRDRPALSS